MHTQARKQRLLRKKTLENEILKEALEHRLPRRATSEAVVFVHRIATKRYCLAFAAAEMPAWPSQGSGGLIR